MNSWDKGDLVHCTGAFRNSAGTLIDPAVVKFSFKTPAGVTTTYTYNTDAQLVKDSTGNYSVDVNANETGVWHFRFFSTGSGQAAGDQAFSVKNTEF